MSKDELDEFNESFVQGGADWRIITLKEENKALKEIVERLSEKLRDLTSPKFKVGDAVLYWRVGDNQATRKFGETYGELVTDIITSVEFAKGEWRYSVGAHGGAMEHLIRHNEAKS